MNKNQPPTITMSVGEPLVTPEDYRSMWVAQLAELTEPPVLSDAVRSELRELTSTVLDWPETFRQDVVYTAGRGLLYHRQSITTPGIIAWSQLHLAKDNRLATSYDDQPVTSASPLVDATFFTDQVATEMVNLGFPRKHLQHARKPITDGWRALQKDIVRAAKQQLAANTASHAEKVDRQHPALEALLARICLERVTADFATAIDGIYEEDLIATARQQYYIGRAKRAVSRDAVYVPTVTAAFMEQTADQRDPALLRAELQAILDSPEGLAERHKAAVQATAQLSIGRVP